MAKKKKRKMPGYKTMKRALDDAMDKGDISRELGSALKNMDVILRDYLEESEKREEIMSRYPEPDEDGIIDVTGSVPYEPFEEQKQCHYSKARFKTLVCGVRAGKTTYCAHETLEKAFARIDEIFWVIAPTYSMLDVPEREIFRLLEPFPETVINRDKSRRRLRLCSGSLIEFKSGEWPDTLRGPGIRHIWLEEAAMLKPEVAQIARTRVSDTLGTITASTTAKGKNWIFDWFMRGISDDPRHSDWASFRWPSNANPYFPKSEWEDAKRDLPEDFFRQEYMGEFLSDVSAVFRGVSKITRPVDEQLEVEGPFFVGVDLALTRNYTVLHAMSNDGQHVDWGRYRGVEWEEQKRMILEMADRWDAIIIVDSTGGQGNIFFTELVKELGKKRVIGKMFTTDSKREMIQLLQTSIEREEITLQDHQPLIDELKWFEYSLTKSGRILYSAPRGYNDDSVWALALANWGRLRGRRNKSPALVRVEPIRSRTMSGGHGLFIGGSAQSRRERALSSGRLRKFLGGA